MYIFNLSFITLLDKKHIMVCFLTETMYTNFINMIIILVITSLVYVIQIMTMASTVYSQTKRM